VCWIETNWPTPAKNAVGCQSWSGLDDHLQFDKQSDRLDEQQEERRQEQVMNRDRDSGTHYLVTTFYTPN